MSVHTSWLSNVKGYQAIRNWTDWFNTPDKLEMLLKGCAESMERNRLTQTEHSDNLLNMKDKLYNLINPETNKIISRNHKFNKSEASKFNYAFSLNGVAKKYVPC